MPSPVEVWHRRLVLFSITTTLALGAEVGYAQLVPKLPQLYAILIRAAVWDCILVGVFCAQVIDLSSWPLLAGTDGGHFLPVAVLLYHAIKISVCVAFEAYMKGIAARGRSLHRTLVSRRALLELAGGTTGSKLLLGRVCFVVSGGAMWLALHFLLWIDDGTFVLTGFIVMLHASYCAAGFAALEPRRTGHGRLVQWLCTGWGSREAFLQGPLKIFGALLAMPFAASVIAAQIWLRTVAMLVWLTVACPCCRLQRDQNVFDAFEREMVVPLLQCSYLAFACTLAAMVMGFGQLSPTERIIVSTSGLYYTAAMLLWTTPAALQSKVAAEEALDAASFSEDGQTQPLRGDREVVDSELELEEIRSACDELRALLYRERHDHSVEVAQMQSRLRDQEVRARTAEKAAQDAKVELALVQEEIAKRHGSKVEAKICEQVAQLGDGSRRQEDNGVKYTPALLLRLPPAPPPPPQPPSQPPKAVATVMAVPPGRPEIPRPLCSGSGVESSCGDGIDCAAPTMGTSSPTCGFAPNLRIEDDTTTDSPLPRVGIHCIPVIRQIDEVESVAARVETTLVEATEVGGVAEVGTDTLRVEAGGLPIVQREAADEGYSPSAVRTDSVSGHDCEVSLTDETICLNEVEADMFEQQHSGREDVPGELSQSHASTSSSGADIQGEEDTETPLQAQDCINPA